MKLPSDILNSVFSEINIEKTNKEIIVSFSILSDLFGEMAEGWQTGIAIDASVSMIDSFGLGLTGTIPEYIKNNYIKKGWIQRREYDGRKVNYFKQEAYEDAIKQGYLKQTQNIVEIEARKFSSFLAENLDVSGKTDIIYWACNSDGKGVQEVGVIDSKMCLHTIFSGPKERSFGQSTYLMPALRYFESKYKDAKKGFFIFITDGNLDDIEEIKEFTKKIAIDISNGKRNLIKCILIGIGNEINENQMIELDDLDTNTNVDIWDHKIAKDMKNIMEIFAELVDENIFVARNAKVYDHKNNIVKNYNDGMPAKGKFSLPLDSDYFILNVEGNIIKQTIRSH